MTRPRRRTRVMLQLELDDRAHRERIRHLARNRGQTMTALILALLADEAARQSTHR